MKKLLVFLIACLLVLSTCLVGCQNTTNDPKDTTAKDGESTPEGEETLPENEMLGLPDDLNYGNAEFTILSYNALVDEFGDKSATDVISQSMVERDSFVEARLGIIFNIESMNGQFNDRLTYAEAVRQSVMLGGKEWDLIGAYSLVPPTLALNNAVIDMRTTEYLDFSKVWWPQFMVDTTTVNGKTYFTSGDVSINCLFQMIPVFFNSELLEIHGFDEGDLYQMVLDGDWTIENFFEMIEDVSVLGGDNVWNDVEDIYAYSVLDETALDSFYYAQGLYAFKEDAEGKLLVAEDDLLSEKILDIFTTVYDSINTYHSMYFATGAFGRWEANTTIFGTFKVSKMREVEDPNLYGILPFPKYEEGTDVAHQTLLGSPHTQYCIPYDVEDADRSSAVLEMLAYASYEYVTPTVFEDTLKLRYSRDNNASLMYDIIRDGLTTDLGILYYNSFGDVGGRNIQSIFRQMIKNNQDNWVSNYRNNYAAGMAQVQEILNGLYSK